MENKYLEKIKLGQVEKEQLEAELATAGNDQNKLQTLGKKYSDLQEMLTSGQAVLKLEKEIEQLTTDLATTTDEEMQNMMTEELNSLQAKLDQEKTNFLDIIEPADPRDNKNAIIEIRAGTGGDEAALFAADLFRMYSRYAEKQGWGMKILSDSQNPLGGFKEVIAEVTGKQVFKHLKYESGVHRVQRVPETEKAGRIHTSAASVVVLPEAEEIDLKIEAKDLRIDTFCAGGHGGQSVNTTKSAVRITHIPTGLVASCQDEKSQQTNKEKAMNVLRSRLFAQEQEKRDSALSSARKNQMGTGDRSDKIRTYNYPQDRISDHRLQMTWHNMNIILDGGLEPIVTELLKAEGGKHES